MLLLRPGFYHRVVRGEDHGWYYDGSSLQFLVEELVAHAAVQVAVPSTSPAASQLKDLDAAIRPRTVLVDASGRVRKQVIAVCSPVMEEFGLEVGPEHAVVAKPDLPVDVATTFGPVYSNLYRFLLGVEYKLQIDLEFDKFTRALDRLRQACKSPKARTYLAEVRGVLSTYRPVKIPSLALTSTADRLRWATFREFVDDATYQEISHDSLLLGKAETFGRGVALIERKMRHLVAKRFFKPLVTLASKIISAVTSVPLPGGELADLLDMSSFSPPILSLDEGYRRAEKAWQAHRGPFVETELSIKHIGAGWTEDAQTGQPFQEELTQMEVDSL